MPGGPFNSRPGDVPVPLVTSYFSLALIEVPSEALLHKRGVSRGRPGDSAPRVFPRLSPTPWPRDELGVHDVPSDALYNHYTNLVQDDAVVLSPERWALGTHDRRGKSSGP